MESEVTRLSRRHLLGMGGVWAGATLLAGRSAMARADIQKISFDLLKQINAGLLNVGYAEAGPTSGPAAILLHGWP
jgi:hypothetical protein